MSLSLTIPSTIPIIDNQSILVYYKWMITTIRAHYTSLFRVYVYAKPILSWHLLPLVALGNTEWENKYGLSTVTNISLFCPIFKKNYSHVPKRASSVCVSLLIALLRIWNRCVYCIRIQQCPISYGAIIKRFGFKLWLVYWYSVCLLHVCNID